MKLIDHSATADQQHLEVTPPHLALVGGGPGQGRRWWGSRSVIAFRRVRARRPQLM
jgi:hypothetical protein